MLEPEGGVGSRSDVVVVGASETESGHRVGELTKKHRKKKEMGRKKGETRTIRLRSNVEDDDGQISGFFSIG